jgi:UDP-N-acetylmuramyl pentapeptide synthase
VHDEVDALQAERDAYLALSNASLDATLDAKLVRDRPQEYRAALGRMIELQTETLAAHDRFVRRAEELGLDLEIVATLREGRVDLAILLQRTIAQLDRLDS